MKSTEETYYIGVAVGGTKTSVVLGAGNGELLHKQLFATKPYWQDVMDDIYRTIDSLPHTAVALGISCGGPLDLTAGTVNSPPNLPSWDRVPILKLLGQHTHLPVYLENDANGSILAEHLWGNARGFHDCMYLTFGTGLGAGIISGGQLLHGGRGLAGEVGHMRIAQEGPEAYGKAGSWEGLCSGRGLGKLYEASGGELITAKEVCDRAENGEERALSVIAASSAYLGKGIAVLLDLLNPECIIIGGIYTRREKLFRRQMEKAIEEEALDETRRGCVIKPSALGEDIGELAALSTAVRGMKSRETNK